MVELLALGPLELWHHEQQYELGSAKERCVLAILLHARGEPVAVDTLMDRVWDGEPPRTAMDTLHSYLSRLRGRLRRAVGDLAQVERHSSGLYRLRVDPEGVDLLRLQRLRTDAYTAAKQGEKALAVWLLRSAEQLWRGEPLAEFTGAWAASARTRLIEDHRRLREERIRLELELGRHADLIGELYELAAHYPLAQKIIAALMVALYRCGRHDEALALYRAIRQRLSEEQGIEPGAELQELHLRILEQDRTLMETGFDTVAAPAPGSRNTLPRDTPNFTGRASELQILLAASESDAVSANALPLTVIHGMPGIGKTALAIHAGHQLRHSYPDGQFYIDLRAYSGQLPYSPAEALAVLLHACGASADLPDSLDERVARWREWTARHRALVILDNARDAAQVSPLLPGAATCRAIVTSRNRLAGLDGATSLVLEDLSAAEAATLFTRIAGAARLSTENTALRNLVNTCGCHPLAVQLLASHFRHRDAWSLHDLLDRLTQATDRLDEIDDAVTLAFRLSYAELSGFAQRLFRHLALHPGPDITLRGVAALAESDTAQVHKGVDELLDSHLLEEPVRDRYQLHDLVRAFGLQICVQSESAPARRAAAERLLAYYLTTAHRAARLTHPHHHTLPLRPEQESLYAPGFAHADEASVWLAMERANLLAVARMAAGEAPNYAALFPHVLAGSLKLWGMWDVAADLYGAAVSALRARGDPAVLARILVERADVLAQRDHGEALHCATAALTLYEGLHDAHGQADALFQTGRAYLAAGRGSTALRVLDKALVLYREVRDRYGEAECLNVHGAVLCYAARYNEAIRTFQAMHAIHEDLHDLHGQVKSLNNMGEIHRLQGRYEGARDYYERSLKLVKQCGGRQELAILNTNLGAVYQATGQQDQALACFRRALDSHQASGDLLGEANVLISMATTYLEAGQREKALLHFTMAEEIARKIDNGYEHQRALIGIAGVQHESGQLSAALKTYRRALDVARTIDFPLGSAHALAGLTRITLSSRHIELAHHYGEQAIALYQSLEARTEADALQHLLRDQDLTGS